MIFIIDIIFLLKRAQRFGRIQEGVALGAIGVGKHDREPFTEKQIALIQTFADQAVIAIENVRLFTETQRLLKETEQRAAELSIINSVQEGLASKLEFQSIIDLVGDKIHDIFPETDMGIDLYDPSTNLISFPYINDTRERVAVDSIPLSDEGFISHVLHTRQTLVINENVSQAAEKFHSGPLYDTAVKKSLIYHTFGGR